MNLKLKYPPIDARMKNEKGQVLIFDPNRKKWLVLTPEEWVRQHIMHYLIKLKGYPAGQIALEKEIELNGTRKRFDILVFDSNKLPLILIECKAPYIELNKEVLEQVLRYNLILNSKFIMISNGVSDFILENEMQIQELPDYQN
ncbi:MAG: type I restriction enzyme HsdR N-terminal domain-containing protein [Sphingobacteriaceae bacterium]|nr:type I restriction enzyme HsdR N-terminal domain-containing protein [Sphingobacteriaceae bacterium]